MTTTTYSATKPMRALLHSVLLGSAALMTMNCAQSAPDTPASRPPVAHEGCDPTAIAEGGPSQTTSPVILGVCDDERLTVVFSTFKDGKAVAIQPEDLSLAIARLVTDDTRPSGYWQSYVNRVESPEAGEWPGTEPAVQATTERGGTLTSIAEGLYAYTLTTDVKAVTEPVEVAWIPEATHRLGLEFRGSVQGRGLGNPVYTWRPHDGAVTDVTTRDIVTTQSCNECHGGIAAHGGARNETEYCVVCHNPGTVDANSGHTMDLSSLVHKIHKSGGLPTEDYVVWGHNDSKHDFSHVGYPQDSRNCLKCHDGTLEATPQGDAWKTASIEACTTCHDNLTFDDTPTVTGAHANKTNADCATCHGPDAKRSPEKAHMTAHPTPHNPMVPENLPVIAYELLSVMANDATQPVATFRIIADGEALDVKSPPAWAKSLPNVRVAQAVTEGTVASPSDFNNSGNGENNGQPKSYGLATLAGGLIANDDGSFTTTPGQLGTVPAGSSMVAVLIEGRVRVDSDDDGAWDTQLGPDSVIRGVDSEDTPRRQIADINKCNACHERLSLHGENRVNNLNVCVTCHNPNATDVNRRPGVTSDGLAERSIAMSSMIHAIHMGENLSADKYVVYGYGNNAHDFKHVAFPNDIANCETCHFPGTYGVPVEQGALAMSVETGGNADPADDLNVSPAGAACTGCHDSESTKAHAMVSSYYASVNLSGTENDSCATCHGPGEAYDATRVHRVPATESQLAPIARQLMGR